MNKEKFKIVCCVLFGVMIGIIILGLLCARIKKIEAAEYHVETGGLIDTFYMDPGDTIRLVEDLREWLVYITMNGIDSILMKPDSMIIWSGDTCFRESLQVTASGGLSCPILNCVEADSAIYIDGSYANGKFAYAYGFACTTSNNASGVTGGSYNKISGFGSHIGGGRQNNVVGNFSVVSGGWGNQILNDYAGIGSGGNNYVFREYSFVGAGRRDSCLSQYSIIGSGWNNVIDTNATYGIIVGGLSNYLSNSAKWGFLGGGYNNMQDESLSVVCGGSNNRTTCTWGTIGGGAYNVTGDCYASVVGGYADTAIGVASIAGGYQARTRDSCGVALTYNSEVTKKFGAIIGGEASSVTQAHGGIVAGKGNSVDGVYGFIGGGYNNQITGSYSTVVGGSSGNAGGDYAFVAGGSSVTALGNYSFATGQATANGILSAAFNDVVVDSELVVGVRYLQIGDNDSNFVDSIWVKEMVGQDSVIFCFGGKCFGMEER